MVDGRGPERRRGQALEDAILDAAWDELVTVGYTGFTMENVAARAGTSRPVLYRRWPSRPELAMAAIRRLGLRDPIDLPDSGSLRGDLIQLLREASRRRHDLAALISVHMGQFFAETGISLAELREVMMAGRGPVRYRELLQRATERGEIDPDRLTQRIIDLPMDLLRHELLTTLQPVPDEVILEIVDDIFLPLVRLRTAADE
jgi:AcrR family transcriptional regulator